MKLQIETSGLTNPTLMHLEAWLIAIDEHLANDHVFDDMDQLASQLELWRSEFCNRESDLQCHWGDQVTVMVYGNEVILISDQRSGEFIKVKEQFVGILSVQKDMGNSWLNKILRGIAATCMVFFLSNIPAKAELIFGIGKKSGGSVAIKNQRQSVKNGKRMMRGLKKASKKVNERLSLKAYGKGGNQ
jgi:hypothetical protein